MTEKQLPTVAFEFNGIPITFDENRFVDLTSIWRAEGSPENLEPYQWKRKEGKGFIDDLALALNLPVGQVISTTRGRNGTTVAHWQVAVAYAKSLSHRIHRAVNEAFKAWVEEEVNPGLKMERAVRAYARQGKSPDWIEKRFKAVGTRKALTDKMKERNCRVHGRDNPYEEITNAIAIRVVGEAPARTREAKGLKKGGSVRDTYDEVQLASIEWAESMARITMDKRGAEGNVECVQAGRDAAKAIRLAMDALGGI